MVLNWWRVPLTSKPLWLENIKSDTYWLIILAIINFDHRAASTTTKTRSEKVNTTALILSLIFHFGKKERLALSFLSLSMSIIIQKSQLLFPVLFIITWYTTFPEANQEWNGWSLLSYMGAWVLEGTRRSVGSAANTNYILFFFKINFYYFYIIILLCFYIFVSVLWSMHTLQNETQSLNSRMLDYVNSSDPVFPKYILISRYELQLAVCVQNKNTVAINPKQLTMEKNYENTCKMFQGELIGYYHLLLDFTWTLLRTGSFKNRRCGTRTFLYAN